MRAVVVSLALSLATAYPVLAEPATITRILDGDTIQATLAGKAVTIRLADLDTPEVHICRPGAPAGGGCAKCQAEVERGLAAKHAAQELLRAGSVVDIARTRGRDRYGRVLARITMADGRDYGTVMVQRGLAAPYTGRGKRPDWCGGVR